MTDIFTGNDDTNHGFEAAPLPEGRRGDVGNRHRMNLVNNLIENHIHPVFVFGTTASGKTTALQSLIYYARQHGMHISLGSSIFPNDYPEARERNKDAKDFFDNGVTSFAHAELPAPTQKSAPFFVPIDIEVDRKVWKFAFLEGMGEWYERESVGGPYRQFQPEIRAILEQYSFGVSIIFVAPTIANDTATRDYSHECLANTMAEYEVLRADRSQDNVLLLLSKWDALHFPGLTTQKVSDAFPSDVLTEVNQWPLFVWSKFASLTGLRPCAKTLMPYSAVWTKDGKSIIAPGRHANVFAKFNRTLWNWLYGNIVESSGSMKAGTAQMAAERKILFTDVVLPEFPSNVYAALTKLLFWITSDLAA
jgi:hypothetical protein